MAELYGKTTGCCKGKGGSMHMGNLDKGMITAIAIVGGGVPVATGVALSFKMRKENRVAACFMGDGGTNEGAFHEAVNMGAVWNLPVIYVVENNLYGASTPVDMVIKLDKVSDRAAGYGIPGITIDGNDPLVVYEATKEAVERAKSGKGPTLLELLTYRITGHSRRDPCAYQPDEEKKKALKNEPIGRFEKYLLSNNVVAQQELDDIQTAIDDEIENAVEQAMNEPDPRPEEALEDLFVEAL